MCNSKGISSVSQETQKTRGGGGIPHFKGGLGSVWFRSRLEWFNFFLHNFPFLEPLRSIWNRSKQQTGSGAAPFHHTPEGKIPSGSHLQAMASYHIIIRMHYFSLIMTSNSKTNQPLHSYTSNIKTDEHFKSPNKASLPSASY
jgi:hypothetical protein